MPGKVPHLWLTADMPEPAVVGPSDFKKMPHGIEKSRGFPFCNLGEDKIPSRSSKRAGELRWDTKIRKY